MHNFLSLVCLVVSLVFLSPLSVQSQTNTRDSDMILSKRDAKGVFALRRDQWNANVMATVKAGIAKATSVPETGLGMFTTNPHGFMIVKPDFSTTGLPEFIQVTVAYREPSASKMSDEAIQDIVAKAKTELSPEYKVTAKTDRVSGGLAIFFTIFKR